MHFPIVKQTISYLHSGKFKFFLMPPTSGNPKNFSCVFLLVGNHVQKKRRRMRPREEGKIYKKLMNRAQLMMLTLQENACSIPDTGVQGLLTRRKVPCTAHNLQLLHKNHKPERRRKTTLEADHRSPSQFTNGMRT